MDTFQKINDSIEQHSSFERKPDNNAYSVGKVVRIFFLLIGILVISNVATAQANKTGCLPPPPDMVGWWTGDGTANDIQGPTFENGILTNGATFGTGMVGQGFSFDGINDYVLVGNPANLNFGKEDFTIDAWVKITPPKKPDVANKAIVSKTSQGSDVQYVLGYRASTDGKLFFAISSSSTVYVEAISQSPGIVDNQFHHVAGIRRGKILELYQDGILVAFGTAPSLISASSSNNVVIGGRLILGNEPIFRGVIDEVEIFNRALCPVEIKSIFDAGALGKCKQP